MGTQTKALRAIQVKMAVRAIRAIKATRGLKVTLHLKHLHLYLRLASRHLSNLPREVPEVPEVHQAAQVGL